MVELRGDTDVLLDKVAELETDGWIDRYTRAVIMEVTTYNAQVNNKNTPYHRIIYNYTQ